MPFVTCDRATKRIITWVRQGTVPVEPGEVGFAIDREVDPQNEIWNGATGLRPLNQNEKNARNNDKRNDEDAGLRALAVKLKPHLDALP